MAVLRIQDLWEEAGFVPNREQKQAIRHAEGPLFITAGPGSGKTRVLLWRTLNLVVFRHIPPEEIFLSTFTEKAARQLRDGIRLLLAMVTNRTGQQFDTSRMYVGTAHSLCRRLILDRRFSAGRHRQRAPVLLDELGQYFHLAQRRSWDELTRGRGWGDEPESKINGLFSNGRGSESRHSAVKNTMALFNRLSEEVVDLDDILGRANDPVLRDLLRMYSDYRVSLISNGIPLTDFALLQQEALRTVTRTGPFPNVFKHVIIDEYQDTNTVQEKLFFALAGRSKNLCVVGDDDQALYRFRGATVENFVDFPERCQQYLGTDAGSVKRVRLSKNYRSLDPIVKFYIDFMERCNWTRDDDPGRQYRVPDKRIKSTREFTLPAVVASTPGRPEDVCAEVSTLVRQLIDQKKVQDPNQIAFLFPSLKSNQVGRMKAALEAKGLKVYAPRAGHFLEVEEAADMFGVMLQIFGRPERGDFPGEDYRLFHSWIDSAHTRGRDLIRQDGRLKDYVDLRRFEIQRVIADRDALCRVVTEKGWEIGDPYDIGRMKLPLREAHGLSREARRVLASARFDRFARGRAEEGRPYDLRYVVTRATSLDWSILELFYQLCGFEHFKHMLDLAESGVDEGPICNLGLITQYLSRFMNDYYQVLTAAILRDEGFVRTFFASYLYALFRLGESEYEDAEDPFPKGRIPFLTIHQAKGLEFPVVILGNPRKRNQGPQELEKLVRPLLDRDGEPLDRLAEFDIMRLFYVALSRAKNLLVIPHWRSQGNYVSPPFNEMLDDDFPRISNLNLKKVPNARLADNSPPKNFSFTGDYLLYRRCPRQYMVFQKYGFAPSTTQTMLFGSLVHQTLEDLHQHLIDEREKALAN